MAETKKDLPKGVHPHDCARCVLLATAEYDKRTTDFYACPGSGTFGPILVRRWSAEPEDYGSMPVMYADGDPRYELPLRLYQERSAKARAREGAS